ncbi:hypothetical protein [Haliea sp. E17]|uniref:hypothetical protein n=1 Tax=Haliea sp. E17 TaxID=3401576 RepID=UPI003AAEA5D1
MHPTITGTLSAITLALLAAAQASGETLDDKIARARSAAPAAVSADATIMVDGKVAVEGSNGWTCMPDTMPNDGAAMCNDAVWMKMMQAMGSKSDFTTDEVGISYMLQGDPEGHGVSNSDPFHPDPNNAPDYVETGPHLMIVVPKALLKGITNDPSGGGPYVMWGDTPYAHIMVPVAE